MLPRAQKRHKFPRPFVQRRLLFSDEKKGSKFTTFSPPRHCEWRIATASRSLLGFFRFLFSVPFIVSRIFPLFFFSSVSRFLLPLYFHRSKIAVKRAISGSTMRDNAATSNRSPFRSFDWNGWLAKISGIVEAGTHCEWHSRPGHAATVYFPGQVGVKNEAAKPIRVLLSLRSLPLPSLKLGWWQCAKLETSHRREIRRAW